MAKLNKKTSLLFSLVFLLPNTVMSPANAAAATVTSISPTNGTVAGGTTVTITGSGFTGATSVSVGAETLVVDTNASLAAGEFKIVSDTSIQFITPIRTGNALTVGPQAVVVVNGSDQSNSNVLYTYRPNLGTPNLNLVTLGDLASRSKGKSVSRTSSAPYMVSGTDSLTGNSYSYESDFYYNPTTTAYLRESFEVPSGSGSITATKNDTNPSELVLESDGGCTHDNYLIRTGVDAGTTSTSRQTYCSVFGPEVYSEAFYATTAQAIAFDWKAAGGQDDYEVYAFLVAVSDATNIPTPTTSNNSLVLHNMGDVQSTYRTTSANIPSNGMYRFRFVNGTYDATGGKAVGARMYIGSIVTVADANSITFANLSDRIATSGDTTDSFTFNLTSTSGAQVSVSASGYCTVSSSYTSPNTTVTVTKTSGLGTCSITASQGASGTYAPASNVTKAFDYRATAQAPDAPTITSVTAGDGTLTIAFNPPNRDGGATITNYSYSVDGVSYTPLSPTSTSSPFTIAGLNGGSTYTVTIKAINSAGSSVASNSISGTPTGNANSGSSSSGSSSTSSTSSSCGAKATVNFLGDSSQLTYTTKMRLNALASQVKKLNCQSISLSGHTATLTNSSTKTELKRVNLSKARNVAVQRYLDKKFKSLGVTISVTSSTYQATMPIGSNKSHYGRVSNRRVEISAN